MTFKKKVENFTCEHCGHHNIGDGFTDHCEKCLWSKHVDIDPGDRKEPCQGLMEPWDVEKRGKIYRIISRCQKCGFLRPSPILPNDDFNVALHIRKKRGDSLL